MSAVYFPEFAVSGLKPRVESILLICYYDPSGISTVPENVSFLQKHSSFLITVVNIFEHRSPCGRLVLSEYFNLGAFNGVILHNSIAYDVDNLRLLDSALSVPLSKYNGVKVLMRQDENHKFKELSRYIGEVGFDVIFTCLPEEALSIIYPRDIVGDVIFQRMLTGYVTPTLRSFSYAVEVRSTDIGYRGSVQPLSFGLLAYEKRKIGDVVLRDSSSYDLSVDISSDWADRLGSNSWFDFLGNTKATLGAESGASIFDLNGDLKERCSALEAKYSDLAYPENVENVLNELSELEGQINYNQISPRHFEAAATKTLQIMYPGEYSGIFKPGVHYFELQRDHSNFSEAVALIKDDNRRAEMVNRAYNDVICNSMYWIENFVVEFDEVFDRALKKKPNTIEPLICGDSKFNNLLLVCAHKPSIDPRLLWISSAAPGDIRIHQLGVNSDSSAAAENYLITDAVHVFYQPKIVFNEECLTHWFKMVGQDSVGFLAVSQISYIHRCLTLPDSELAQLLGAPVQSERLVSFKWYLRYFLDTAATLISNGLRFRGLNAVVATDLDSLLPALFLKSVFKIPVIYDAHEYWPEADVSACEFEREFWERLEGALVGLADHRITVTPGLAKLMENKYSAYFDYLPNCEIPNKQWDELRPRKDDQAFRKFIFQGNFAPKRGVDLLIAAWPFVDKRAVLILRGPDNAFKLSLIEQARETGLLNERIFFPEAVSENSLVFAARDGDVGLIPYTPSGANYSNCCPNKLSQYMAAGLPILANKTSFVEEVVENGKLGLVCDFSRQSELVSAVDHFVSNPAYASGCAENAKSFFNSQFNWRVLSIPFYDRISALTKDYNSQRFCVYPSVVLVKQYFPVKTDLKYKFISQVDVGVESFGLVYVMRRFWRLLPLPIKARVKPVLLRLLRLF